MTDVILTLPLSFKHMGKRGLEGWIDEGDPAGSEWTGNYWDFTTGGRKPKIKPGERVYICHAGKLIGYAPLVELVADEKNKGFYYLNFIRGGDAVAVTIGEEVKGFRGWRYRWWDYEDEIAYPNWHNGFIKPEQKTMF